MRYWFDTNQYHMKTLRSSLIRLAHQNPDLRDHLLPLLGGTKVATEFATKEQLNKYLKEHPGADKSKHTVVDPVGKANKHSEMAEDYSAKANKSGHRDDHYKAELSHSIAGDSHSGAKVHSPVWSRDVDAHNKKHEGKAHEHASKANEHSMKRNKSGPKHTKEEMRKLNQEVGQEMGVDVSEYDPGE